MMQRFLGFFLFAMLESFGYRPRIREHDPAKLPAVARALGALRAKRFDALASLFDELRPDAYIGTVEALVDALEQDESSKAWLSRLRLWANTTRNFNALVVLGFGLVRYAWTIRGSAIADEVGEDAWEPFFSNLQEADDVLTNACEMQPDRSEPLCIALITARGLQLDMAEHWGRFETLIGLSPRHYRGHLWMLENIKEKWGGSHGEMFKFARERAVGVPEGDPLHALVVHAHFEMRNLRYWDDDAHADLYFKDRSVADEVMDAWRRSVGSENHVPGAETRDLCNLFAAALYLSGHAVEARQILRKMRDECTEFPWCLMGKTIRERYSAGWVVGRVRRELGVA